MNPMFYIFIIVLPLIVFSIMADSKAMILRKPKSKGEIDKMKDSLNLLIGKKVLITSLNSMSEMGIIRSVTDGSVVLEAKGITVVNFDYIVSVSEVKEKEKKDRK